MTSKKQNPLIFLTAGGTGGHVFPAEALAEELSSRQYRLTLITDKRGLNNYHGTLGKIPNYAVCSGALMGKSKWVKIKSLIKTAFGIVQCMYLILKHHPICVVGFGGYASFPCSMAAILLGIDLIIHEQNSVMSRTNRFLSRYASFVATSFKKTKYAPGRKRKVQTGMPVRKSINEIYNTAYPKITKTGHFNILVLGGSQGAKIFSQVVPEAIKNLDNKTQKKIKITQQCRKDDLEKVKEAYRETKCESNISDFFNNMAELYKQSHLVISRAGASTVCEISTAGRPAILVPLPTAADDHQTSNAADFKTTKSGIVLAQKDFTPTTLSTILNDFIQHPSMLAEMAKNTKKFAITDAAYRLANLVEKKVHHLPDSTTMEQ